MWRNASYYGYPQPPPPPPPQAPPKRITFRELCNAVAAAHGPRDDLRVAIVKPHVAANVRWQTHAPAPGVDRADLVAHILGARPADRRARMLALGKWDGSCLWFAYL